jgi:PAP2 superfamily
LKSSTVPGDVQSSSAWLLRLWAVVAAFAAVTVVRSFQVDIAFRDPHGAILLTRVALSAGIFAVLVVIDGARRTTGRWTLRGVSRGVRERWTRRRLAEAASVLLAYHVVYFCYHNLKSWDVFNRPRDQLLLSWDRWLFLGHSPAALLHQILGEHVAAYVLLVVYESFSTIVSVSVVAAVVFSDHLRDGAVFIASMVWVWVLGVACYYAIPSIGPFWSAPHTFSGLPHTMVQDTQARYLAQRADLLAHPHAADAFAQVSAFASLHVAVTCVILLTASYYGLRRTTYVLFVFLCGTILATIYLGWHFALDDVAGLAIAWVSMQLGRYTVRPTVKDGEPALSAITPHHLE